MKKLSKVLIVTGVVILALGILSIIGGLVVSFRSMRFNESAGIGAVGGALQFALIGSVAGIIGVLLIVVGLIMFLISKRREIK